MTLRSKLIRLAHDKPHLREHLLSLLQEDRGPKTAASSRGYRRQLERSSQQAKEVEVEIRRMHAIMVKATDKVNYLAYLGEISFDGWDEGGSADQSILRELSQKKTQLSEETQDVSLTLSSLVGKAANVAQMLLHILDTFED